jgi:multiple sugar transport system permease protein
VPTPPQAVAVNEDAPPSPESAVATAIAGTKRRARRKWDWSLMGAWAVAGVFLLFSLFPVYWIVLTAFRARGEIFSYPVSLLPRGLTLDNVRTVWFGTSTNDPVLNFLGDSAVCASIAAALATLAGVCCAYAMGRFRVGGKFLATWMLSQRFVPVIALIVPLYMLYRQLGLLDTYAGIILLYTAFNVPLAVWLMLGFVRGLPDELEHAALIDGASYFQTFRLIALPLLKPGIAVTAIFTFIFSWNEYLIAYQLAGQNVSTVMVYLPRLRTAVAELYGEIAAASLLSVIPALVFAWVMQRNLVQGITLGGGKEL